MSEHAPTPASPESANIINPGPNAAITAYFAHVAPPAPEEIVQAADVVGAAYREIENTQDALNICVDLVRDVPEATTVLAHMIGTGNEIIPKRWRSNHDDIRMVLSMTGHMEIGYLRAQLAAVQRGPALILDADERITDIERLIDDLR